MFNEVISLLTNPLVLKVLLAYWVFSAFVGALPSPDELSAYVKSPLRLLGYRVAFGFLHGLSGNISRAAIALRVPGAEAPKS